MKYQLKWSKNMSVHNEEIDKQHRYLFSVINKLVDAHQGRLDSDVTNECLRELVDYSGYHFNEELKYMGEHQYPLINAHIDSHAAYIKKIGAFLEDLKEDQTQLNAKLLAYLAKWWTNHVLTEDMKYAEYIGKRNE